MVKIQELLEKQAREDVLGRFRSISGEYVRRGQVLIRETQLSIKSSLFEYIYTARNVDRM
jgi:hypothetical protein